MKKVLILLLTIVLMLPLLPQQTKAANVNFKDVAANSTTVVKSPTKKPAVKSTVKKPAVKSPVKKPAVKSPPVVTGTGSLKGSVTWQYNDFVGTKADVGSQVFLIPIGFKQKNFTKSQMDLYSTIGSIPAKSNLQYAKVNGFGAYEITDIPVGKYHIIISSKSTNRDMDSPLSLEGTLKPLLGSTNYDAFFLFNLSYRKSQWSTIEIKKDKTIDYSHDFGNTYF